MWLAKGFDEPKRALWTLRNDGLGLVFAVGLMAFLSASCKSGPDLVRIIESEVIDSLLAAAPQTLIDTDALKEKVWFPDAAVAEMRDSLVLSGIYSFTIARDSLYLADFMGHSIFAAGLDGRLRRQIGRMGMGPQEYHFPDGPYFDGTKFFVVEKDRIQVLSIDWSYVGVVPAQDPGMPLQRDVAVTATRLYVSCPHGAAYRICPYRTEVPFLQEAPFLPSLEITEVLLNGAILKAAASDGSHVLAAFIGLPYVFVFNAAHEHVHTIRFFGSDIREHARDFIGKRDGSDMIFQRDLWRTLDLLSPELLAVAAGRKVYFIRIAEHEQFTHIATVRMSLAQTNESEVETEYARSAGMELHDGYLYVNSFRTPHVLRYRVDL